MSTSPIDVTDASDSCAVDRSCPPESGAVATGRRQLLTPR